MPLLGLGYRGAVGLRHIACGLVLAACAGKPEETPPPDDAPVQQDGGLVGGPKMCPTGQLAVEVGSDGSVRCAAPDAEIKTTIDASCGIYYGWRDNCDGCTTPPTKFGRAGAACTQSGTDTTCTMPSLLGTTYLSGRRDLSRFERTHLILAEYERILAPNVRSDEVIVDCRAGTGGGTPGTGGGGTPGAGTEPGD